MDIIQIFIYTKKLTSNYEETADELFCGEIKNSLPSSYKFSDLSGVCYDNYSMSFLGGSESNFFVKSSI